MLTKDMKDLIRAFNANRVEYPEYLIIGGFAFGVHARPARPKTSTCSSAPMRTTGRRFLRHSPSMERRCTASPLKTYKMPAPGCRLECHPTESIS